MTICDTHGQSITSRVLTCIVYTFAVILLIIADKFEMSRALGLVCCSVFLYVVRFLDVGTDLKFGTHLDVPTLVFLFSILFLIQIVSISKLSEFFHSFLENKKPIIGKTILSSVLALLLTNDGACLLITPIVMDQLSKNKASSSEKYISLLTIATTSNIASALLFTSNPQNALLVGVLDIPMYKFILIMILPTTLCLGLNYWALCWLEHKIGTRDHQDIDKDDPSEIFDAFVHRLRRRLIRKEIQENRSRRVSLAPMSDVSASLYDDTTYGQLVDDSTLDTTTLVQGRNHQQGYNTIEPLDWNNPRQDNGNNDERFLLSFSLPNEEHPIQITSDDPETPRLHDPFKPFKHLIIISFISIGLIIVFVVVSVVPDSDPRIFTFISVMITVIVISLFLTILTKFDPLNAKRCVPPSVVSQIELTLNNKALATALKNLDYEVLVFFSGIFIVVGALIETCIPQDLLKSILSTLDLGSYWGIMTFSFLVAILSNIVSNVPVIIILKQLPLPHKTLCLLVASWSSTLAGNLTFIGSAANILVAELSHNQLNFMNYTKYGAPTSILFIIIGTSLIFLLYWPMVAQHFIPI